MLALRPVGLATPSVRGPGLSASPKRWLRQQITTRAWSADEKELAPKQSRSRKPPVRPHVQLPELKPQLAGDGQLTPHTKKGEAMNGRTSNKRDRHKGAACPAEDERAPWAETSRHLQK